MIQGADSKVHNRVLQLGNPDILAICRNIEEGFILDVLKTYTSYKVAFSLAHHGKDGVKVIESKEVDQSEAMKGIMGWVRLHEYNIAQRVQVVVEHYRKHVAGMLGGQAKAMVVTGSRKEAVRWQKATRKYIADRTELLGAIRLPNNAFAKNANTEVTTDIVFLRKLPDEPVGWVEEE